MTEAPEAPNGPKSKRGGLISEKESSIHVPGVRGSENMSYSKGALADSKLEQLKNERARPRVRKFKSNASDHVVVTHHNHADT